MQPVPAGNYLDNARTGVEIPVELGLSHLQAGKSSLALATVINITERRETERRLESARKEAAEVATRDRWMANGQQTLNAAIQGEPTVDQVAQNTIDCLAKHLSCAVGACYVRTDSAREVETQRRYLLKGRHALAEIPSTYETFTEGHSLIGQAVLDQRRILLDEIPEGHLSIRTGLATAHPKQILIQPLVYQDSTIAVIELGSLHVLDKRKLEFLDRVGESIASAIQSAQNRAKLDHLLSKTQVQSEELLVHQEELRVANRQLTERTIQLEESERLLKSKTDQLQQLNRELNEKSKLMSVQQEELRLANEQHEQNNIELTRQNEMINEQRREVEEGKRSLEANAKRIALASKYKSEFLANMSHEFRTPLNSLLILARQLAENRDDNLTVDQLNAMKVIESAGNDLLRLVNDILDLSRVEAGKLHLEFSEFSVRDLVARLNAQFRPLAADKGLHFEVMIHDSAPHSLTTDGHRLEQILRNFLSNAIKFTDRGRIQLEVKGCEGNLLRSSVNENRYADSPQRPTNGVCFAVADTGIGIPAAEQSAIFEAFQQGDGSIRRRFGGTGLGLTISRELARMLSAQIRFESAEGVGSTFRLVMPASFQAPIEDLSPVSGPGEAKELQSQTWPEETIHGSTMRFATRRDGSHASDGPRDTLTERSTACSRIDMGGVSDHPLILLLNNSEPMQAATKRVLASPEFRAEVVTTTEQLIAKVDELFVDCLVIDQHALQSVDLRLSSQLPDDECDDAQQRGDRFAMVVLGTSDLPIQKGDINCSRVDGLISVSDDGLNHSHDDIGAASSQETSVPSPARVRIDSPAQLIPTLQNLIPKAIQRPRRPHAPVAGRDVDAPDISGPAKLGRGVLLVDDDMRNLFALSSILEQAGFSVFKAENGRVAIDRLRENSNMIGLILMDVMMPVMDGLEAMRQIRQETEWQQIPIIALTAQIMPEDRTECLRAGASDYLVKPVDSLDLIALVNAWIAEIPRESQVAEPATDSQLAQQPDLIDNG